MLDFFGTGVTPGHVYYRADSQKAHKFETLIDILRGDGVVQKADGTNIRAATGVPVGDVRDGFVWVVAGTPTADGGVAIKEKGRRRLGTRFIADDGTDICIADIIDANGGRVNEEELIVSTPSGTVARMELRSFGLAARHCQNPRITSLPAPA